MSAATYGSDGSITDAELLGIDDGLTTQIPVGGGAGVALVWTTATGTGAPVRAGSPTFTTQITTPVVTNAAALALGSTAAGVNITTHTDAGDDFTVNTTMLVVEGDTGNVGIGTATPAAKLEINYTLQVLLRLLNTDNTDAYTEIAFGNAISANNNGALGFYTSSLGSASNYIYLQMNNDAPGAGLIVADGGSVGIGTVAPGNPLAVNRAADGVIVDFESADTVEGNVSISGNTTSYNAFVGSHYTQLKTGQAEPPVGAVMISTGEIIPCSVSRQKFTKVQPIEAVTIIPKVEAVEIKDIEIEDKDNILSEETTYAYDSETDTEKPTTTYTYGTKTVQKKRLKDGVHFHKKTRTFYTINAGYVKKDDGFYKEETVIKQRPLKEYFVYVDTTGTAADKRAYGVWLGKMSDDAKGMSFGEDSKPVYLVAQVGLFKIRATDTNGNIQNGDYLETSSRPMEAQRQAGGQRLNSTIAKALVDVNWATVPVDPALGYKWRLIPCTF